MKLEISQISLSSATIMLRHSHTTKGRPMVIDENNFSYTKNNESKTTTYWICSNEGCKSRIATRKSTGNLTTSIPEHQHICTTSKKAALRAVFLLAPAEGK